MEGVNVYLPVEEEIKIEIEPCDMPSFLSCELQEKIKVDEDLNDQRHSVACREHEEFEFEEEQEDIKIEEDPFGHLSSAACVQQEKITIELDSNDQPASSVMQNENKVKEEQPSYAACVEQESEEAR
jgi:hypothetical protein